ncbi:MULTISPECIES: metal ABC transporter solute-binding protein, Zn/Mn family [Dietzia]|uniref:metal ABC transporter solute-binding protein, Zn/Mn family n=1 Tax=Dietzia TaxID=37914 RepID=UPI0013D3C6B7|nr:MULTISPECIES: zinc ABC transporter substrate-binding protein [Dietzia]MCT2061554.1 zinc ABC transporter substrate-binding protein [Dietzia cinnamea]MCT2237819.1 zinc ABC transporter substrate-binding protein [Dietzia cinnamea]MCT2302452.1 zinc ABC transporter substrate-binding protein [Dietzia cinnamea]
MALTGVALTTAVALTACSSTDDGGASDTAQVSVVASTNVWGSVAEAVAGEHATVTAIIDEPSADPHSFEASPADAAAITDASLVVYNGGGYDKFVDDVLGGSGSAIPAVDAFSLAERAADTPEEAAADDDGHDDHDDHAGHAHGSINEHVWYDTAVAGAMASAIAEQLAGIDPANAAAYTANAETFRAQLTDVDAVIASIAADDADAVVVQSEPIAHYLIEAARLDNATPAEFERAMENGTDPSPAAITETLALMGDKRVRALIYNVQTQDDVSQNLRATAEESGIPVVEVTETLPENTDYITWITAAAQSLGRALQSS